MLQEKDIQWYRNIDEAREASEQSGKPVFIMFYSETCAASANMFDTTIAKWAVIREISVLFEPVFLEVTSAPDAVLTYGVDITPAFVAADSSGFEVTRWIGSLPDVEFISHMKMAAAKAAFKKGDYTRSVQVLDDIMLNFPTTSAAPEATFYFGLAKFRLDHDPIWLTRAFKYLREAYRDSIWTMKASAWGVGIIETTKKAA